MVHPGYFRSACLVVLFVSSIVASASDGPPLLTRECEEALALSALPNRLRADASVISLGENGYSKTKAGAGPFTCIVERNHPDSIIPQCVDAEGADTIIPTLIYKSTHALDGMSESEAREAVAEKVREGEFASPDRPGLSYMMSDYNYPFVTSAGEILKIPPHLMFYGPHLNNEDIGGSLQSAVENVGTPFLFREGPYGYMIVYVEHRADPDDVALKCRGQLGEAPRPFDPFPKG